MVTDSWDLGRRVLSFERRPLVMGILNVTPDSFSDGGRYEDPATAIEAAVRMDADGADIIDIGGESTRPYSDPLCARDELSRVMPVVEGLAGRLSAPISIDTSKATVAEAAILAGAEIINDVTGLAGDPQMPDVVVQHRVGVCVMHMRGTPQTMQDDLSYDDVVEEICRYLVQRRQFCLDLGLSAPHICLDPGIGFGKSHEQNLQLLRATRRLVALGSPLLIGHSRKGFIGKILGDKSADRGAATLGVSLAVAAAGAHVIRVHDVKPTVDALKSFEAVGGLGTAN